MSNSNTNTFLKIVKNLRDKTSSFSQKLKPHNLIQIKNVFFAKMSYYPKSKKYMEITCFIICIISYVLYYLSLGGCDGTQTECLKNSNIAYYYLLANYCFLSAGFISFLIYLMYIKQVSKYHLIHILIVFPILFLSDTSSTLMNHGIYNIIGFFIFFIFYLLLLFAVSTIQDILSNKTLKTKLIVLNSIVLLLIFCRFLIHNSLKKECKDWDLGLNNTRIKDDKDKYICQINRPISCHLTYLDKKQDLSRLLKLQCSNNINSNQVINSRNLLIKYINKNQFEKTKRFGFPLTNTDKFQITYDITPDTFTQKVFDNIIDMDNPPQNLKPDEYPEVTLNFEEIGDDYKQGDKSMKYMGKIKINITKNETLSQLRKAKEYPNSLFNNIIIIYTDAVSRVHFQRKMPKTCAFIEKLMKNNFDNDFNDFFGVGKQDNEINTNKTSNIININNTINTNNSNNNIGTKIRNLGSKEDSKKDNKKNKKSEKNKSNNDNKPKIDDTNKKKNKEKNEILDSQEDSNLNKKKSRPENEKEKNDKKNIKNKGKKNKSKKKELSNINDNNYVNNNISNNNINNNDTNNNNINNNRNNFRNTNYLNDKYYAYQFLKYHTFTSGTRFNAMPMFYGKSIYELAGTNIIKNFKELGFITAQSIDMCSKEVWEPEKEPPKIDFDKWDHENVAMFCDPSYMDRKSLYSIYKGVYSLLRRCFYGKEVHDYIFEYGTKFWEAYPDNKKFLRLAFNDGHESTFEVLQYLDEPMYNFLNTFYEKGYLKNTALIIISDHGNHMPGIYNLLFSEQYETERVLGNFVLIINSNSLFNDNKEKFKIFNQNLMENQQSIITPYDVYNTLIHILYADSGESLYTKRGKSIFKEIDNSNRDCNFFDQDNEEKGLCKCVPNSKYEKFVYYDKN